MLVLLAAVATGAVAQTTYKVSVKEGTEDANKWEIAPAEATTTGVAAGTEVKATYGGMKKVKSVKAVKKAKPAATVGTAPTATASVTVGSTTALVTAGTATGGTMMYKVTTANTQPTSTEGFSATVPTASGLAAGTYYVWYYVKADNTHIDSEIGGPVTVTVKAPTLADVFTDGAVVCVKVNTENNNWFGVTGTYNASSSTYTCSGESSVSLTPSSVSMTKDGNNLVATVTRYNTYTVTINTTNNTYTESATSSSSPVWGMTTLKSITVNGTDITSTLTNATPTETTVTWNFSEIGGTQIIYSSSPFSRDGIVLSCESAFLNFDEGSISASGTLTLTNTLGKKFTSIVINSNLNVDFSGFNYEPVAGKATWTGEASSVTIDGYPRADGVTSIEFHLK